MKKQTLEGILHFHSETGTEGGDWAFQDQRFISKTSPSFGVYARQTVWDLHNSERKGTVLDKVEVFFNDEWLPLPDPMTDDPDFYASSLFCGERDGDHEADKRLMEKYGFKMKYDADRMDERFGKGNWYLEDPETAVTSDGTKWVHGGTPSTEPQRPYGIPQNGLTRSTVKWEDGVIELKRLSNTLLVTSWSYEGLHILGDGDYLTIYDPLDKKRELWQGIIALQQHDLFTQHASGWWIHADQKGIDREVWAKYFFDECPAKLVPYGK